MYIGMEICINKQTTNIIKQEEKKTKTKIMKQKHTKNK